MTSGGLKCGSDVSRYHGDSRHMFRTSTRGASDGNKRAHTSVHAHTHTHTLRASRTGNCQEKSESTFSSFSGISTPRFLSEGLSTSSRIH